MNGTLPSDGAGSAQPFVSGRNRRELSPRGLRSLRRSGSDAPPQRRRESRRKGTGSTRTVETNLRFANLPWRKRIADFDFAFQPSVERRLFDELATGRFLAEGRNVLLLGPPGVGKTHLAVGLGLVAAELGHRLYFTNALEMARKLAAAFAANRLGQAIKTLVQPKLLILDEVGYLSLETNAASMLFEVICKRYERRVATVVTSNKPFDQWGQVFANDPVLAGAALDRLLHQSSVVNIKGASYRRREKRQAGLFPTQAVTSEPGPASAAGLAPEQPEGSVGGRRPGRRAGEAPAQAGESPQPLAEAASW